MKKIKIIIVDDHEIFRSGLEYVLNQHDNFKVIGVAENGNKLLSLLNDLDPDVVLLDIEMPEMNGMDASREAISKYPKLKIIVLSSYSDKEYYSNMIIAGVKGFVLKNTGIIELEEAITSVNEGRNYFSQELLQKLVFNSINPESKTLETEVNLTARESEVLKLIGSGQSNQEIGKTLFISPLTVSNHRSKLLSKTGTKNTASLIMFSIKYNLITVE